MTAEIAILNRNAVALAADSAVSLRVGRSTKIYETADKIYEACLTTPIALMIFNNLHFMDIPLEILVKQFRLTQINSDPLTVFEYKNRFFNFLCNEVPIHKETQDRHVWSILMAAFHQMRSAFERRLYQMAERSLKPPRFNPHDLFLGAVKEHINDLSEAPIAECFSGMDDDEVLSHHLDAFKEALNDTFSELPLNSDDKELLRQLAALTLSRNVFSEDLIGFVFSGYGKNEIFPSLNAFVCDGVIAGKLKTFETHKVDIDRRVQSNGASVWRVTDIIPFAQTDMAERFVFGIDPEFESSLKRHIRRAHREVATQLSRRLGGRSKAKREKWHVDLTNVLDDVSSHLETDTFASIKSSFRKQIEDMVLFMPKQELAFLAESIVNVTSIKRKVSAEDETVGGPIDVAVITKGEGLVWTKRKHYFDPTLNPRYFERARRTVAGK